MQGFRCLRKAGWDTHGLPVEVEVCKELGIHSKDQIEEFGIEPFIKKCQQSVWHYMQQWERLTERLGFWVDLKQAYVTYHKSFVESVWWSLKTLFDEGLLYQGHKIVWWWAQGGTALGAGEVGQGYRQVADPSVYVRFPIVADAKAKALGLDASTSLLVWTTTPWTLPSNQFAAVSPELDYVVVEDAHEGATQKLVVAAALHKTLAAKVAPRVEDRGDGEGGRARRAAVLAAVRLLPRQDRYEGRLACRRRQAEQAWRVLGADFVTMDSSASCTSPAFGEVDYDALQQDKKRFTSAPELIYHSRARRQVHPRERAGVRRPLGEGSR